MHTIEQIGGRATWLEWSVRDTGSQLVMGKDGDPRSVLIAVIRNNEPAAFTFLAYHLTDEDLDWFIALIARARSLVDDVTQSDEDEIESEEA